MKKITTFCLLFSFLIFTSCATVFPVHNPDISRDEFSGLIAAGSERTVCYEKGFRGGMLFLDVIFGGPFLFAPVIIDAATGKYTAYYYHHNRCEKVKGQERKARLADFPQPTTVTIIQSAPKPVPVEQSVPKSEPTVQPVQSSSWDAPLSQQKQDHAPRPVPAVEPATVPEPAPAPISQPQVEEDPEYDILF